MNAAINKIKAKIGFKAECILETDEERQVVWDALNALESQETYRWHDLRKNPEDLPEEYNDIIYVTNDDSVYVITKNKYIIGWRDGCRFDSDDIEINIPTYDIAAWRYLERFEAKE